MSKIKYINKLTESNVLSYEQVYVISVPDLINTGSTNYNEYCNTVLTPYNVSSDETLNSFLMKRNFSDEVKLITNNIINLHNTDVEYDRVYDIAEDAVTMDELSPIVNILYYDLVTLKDSSGLTTGITYFITDREIWIKALSTSELSLNGHRRMRVVKSDNYVPSGTILGVWSSTITPSIGDTIVWGGKVWSNLNGNVGSYVDDTSLGFDEWSLYPTNNNTFYESKIFLVVYDFTNDTVKEQRDNRNNIMYADGSGYSTEITDWGNANMFSNTCWGIYNNSCDFNGAHGVIYNNNLTDPHSFIGRNYRSSCRIRGNTGGAISDNGGSGEYVSLSRGIKNTQTSSLALGVITPATSGPANLSLGDGTLRIIIVNPQVRTFGSLT